MVVLAMIALAGRGLDNDSSCHDWLDASADEQRDFVEERIGGRRVSVEHTRLLAVGTCRFAVRSGSERVTADAAVRQAVRALGGGLGL